MCDNCNKRGLAALEAIANGEDPPQMPETARPAGLADLMSVFKEHRPTFELPFPVIAFETDNGNVGILTDQDGWTFFKRILESLGGVGGQ